MALNTRQQKFVGAYIQAANATEAAKLAGYTGTPHTLEVTGSRLLRNAEISAAIAESRKEVAAEARFDAVQWLKDGLEIARSDIGDYYDEHGAFKALKDMTPEQRRAISSIEVEAETEKRGRIYKLKLWPKNESRDQIARHLGFYEKDNAQVGDSFARLVRAATQKRREGKR